MWRAWRVHYKDVRHGLAMGYFQGWDLHAAQLPTRYAAVYAFFFGAREAASERLSPYTTNLKGRLSAGAVVNEVIAPNEVPQLLLAIAQK